MSQFLSKEAEVTPHRHGSSSGKKGGRQILDNSSSNSDTDSDSHGDPDSESSDSEGEDGNQSDLFASFWGAERGTRKEVENYSIEEKWC